MSEKIKLGDDFDEDAESAETSKEEEKESSEDESTEEEEKDNSEETSKEKKPDEDEESESDNKDEDKDESEEDKDETEKQRELKGLEDAEKDLDEDLGELDEKIVSTKSRIVDKRRDRREKRELVDKIDKKIPSEELEDDLSDIDEQTIGILDRYTKSKDLVPRSELEKINRKNVHKVAETAFFDKYKEYNPENDSNDTLYNAIKEELSYFATPTDTKLIPKLFEKAHAEVVKRYPDKFKKKSDTSKQIVKKERTKTASLGAGSSGGGSEGSSDKSDKKEFNSKQTQVLRDGGWSEEDITRLTS